MHSKNSKTSKPHVLVLKLINKLDLRIGEKIIASSNLSIYYTWKNMKSSHNNNKFKYLHQHGSDSVSDIQDYFEYILKKYGENTDKSSVQIYVNKIENRVTFKIKDGYSLELSLSETMKLLGTTGNKVTKDKNGENALHLEIREVVLVHCNTLNNDYQQDSRVLYTFVQNKPFGSLLKTSPTNHIFLKTFNSEYPNIKVWLTDQNSHPLEIEGGKNFAIVINPISTRGGKGGGWYNVPQGYIFVENS